MNAAGHLASARAALVEGRPGDCAEALAAFEAAIEQEGLPTEEAIRAQAELAALGRLTQAALEGVAEARAQIEGAVRAASRLSTYAADGQRQDRDLRQNAPRRY